MTEAACAVLIATKDGEATVEETISWARFQADVYVVSDGSTDGTVEVATSAGAQVLALEQNIGKPNALREGFHHFNLEERYPFTLVLDDDTRLAPDFVQKAMRMLVEHDDVVAVCGETRSDVRRETRWNPLVAGRAMAYWRYGIFIKRGQNALRVITVLPGSNTVLRSSTFGHLLRKPLRYIVDDTQWLLDIQTERLGRVVYEPDARAYVQDPTSVRSYYKQMLRWMWGTFQGIRGHRIGRTWSWFSATYVALIFDWFLYLFVWPAALIVIGVNAAQDGLTQFAAFLGIYMGGYAAWATVAAIALKNWRFPLMTPVMIWFDWLNRVIFVHGAVKAWRQPTVEKCVWESPTRIDTRKEETA
jgi:cellulose synthase/poly-beta-1,6-N-acetylglucosamine synthase-like glycosyltransferase